MKTSRCVTRYGPSDPSLRIGRPPMPYSLAVSLLGGKNRHVWSGAEG